MKKIIIWILFPLLVFAITFGWGMHTKFWYFYHTIGLYYFLTSLTIYVFSISKNKSAKLISANLFIVLLTLFGIELYLRFIDRTLSTHMEQNRGRFYTEATGVIYTMQKLKEGNILYMNPPANRLFNFSQSEFSYDYPLDSLGLYTACSIPKDTSSYRILTLGDSFTFGLGAPADSSWPCQLQKLIQTEHPNTDITIINGANLGSDPVYAFKSLKEIYYKTFQPDLITLSVNHSDIDEVMVRGDETRYDTYAPAIKDPLWMPLFGMSYVFRLVMVKIFKYDLHLLINTQELPVKQKVSKQIIANTLLKMNSWCNERDIEFIVLYHPIPYDIITKEMACLQPVMDSLKTSGIKQLNIMSCFSRKGILPTENSIFQYYWPIDRHHNSKGYHLFATVMAEQLDSLGYLK